MGQTRHLLGDLLQYGLDDAGNDARSVVFLPFMGRWEAGLLRVGTMKTPLILVIVTLLSASCSSGGDVHVHHFPSPTPHKVVMIR